MHRSPFTCAFANCIVAACGMLLASCTNSQSPAPLSALHPDSQQAKFHVPDPKVTAPMFNALLGETWKGTLTYLDYSSSKTVSIPCSLMLEKQQPAGPPTTLASYQWMTGYDDEPHANSATNFAITLGGRAISFGDVTERVVAVASTPSDSVSSFDEGTRIIITEHQAMDDDRPATVRKVYAVSKMAFSVQKLVRFDGEQTFFERHVYRWTRDKR